MAVGDCSKQEKKWQQHCNQRWEWGIAKQWTQTDWDTELSRTERIPLASSVIV